MDKTCTSRFKVAGGLFALISMLLLIGCAGVSKGNGSDPGSGGSGDPQPGQSTLSASPSPVAFGNVAVGSTKTISVTVTNSSSSASSVSISQIAVSGTGFSATSVPQLPVSLQPGASTTVGVKFAPTSGSAASGSLAITSDASNSPLSVSLSGTGLAAGQLGVSPSTLDFGDVTVGSSANKTGTLTAGATDINVSSAGWNGQGYSVSGITFPVKVAAGTNTTYTVTFTPQATGSAPGSISFVSDASNSPTSQTFSGNGVQASQHSVALSWTASPSNVIGYNLYRGTQSGGPYPTKLTSSPQANTNFSDSNVTSGTTYYYVATAVDSNNVESVDSNEASANIP